MSSLGAVEPNGVNGVASAGALDGSPFVVIDAYNLSLEKGTGVSTYARNLSKSLKAMGCEVGVLYGQSVSARQPKLLQEIMFFDPQPSPLRAWQRAAQNARALFTLPWTSAISVPITGAVLQRPVEGRLPYFDTVWNASGVYRKAGVHFETLGLITRVSMERRPDLFHWTYPLPMRVTGVPNVYTLHDLVPLRLPYTTLDRKSRYLKLVRWICKTAAHIVTVSECSKRDIVDLLGVHPDRVTNTYQAVSIPEEDLRKPEEEVALELQGTFGLRFKNYFLYYGALEPKKNIGRLLQAYFGSGVRAPLVIVGARSWKADNDLKLLDADVIRGSLGGGGISRAFRIDYVPSQLLHSLIRGAKAVLFPSLYEGFGLPVLEAMTLGTPVLTSNTSSVPEVAGDAALLVDPYNVTDIAKGIEALDGNEALRAELRARGSKRAALFSEAEYTRRLAAVYEKVLVRQRARVVT